MITKEQQAAIEEAVYKAIILGSEEVINNPEKYNLIPKDIYNDEYWYPIPDFVGIYEVSNLGRIRRLSRITTRIDGGTTFLKGYVLKQMMDRDGYMLVNLSSKTFRVHRIVAKTFKPNMDSSLQVNHIDGNKANNHVSNLEWCTSKENVQHFHKVMNKKALPVIKDKSVGRKKPVINIDTGKIYSTISEAAKDLGVSVTTLSDQLKGRYNVSYKLQHNVEFYKRIEE